mmetsp:Transcript_82376/g.233605  ORF Transcript_82376/g.233605 Transcript_82376/m.233605 type:complete len:481 (-) Transcript_82376:113-1555(-)
MQEPEPSVQDRWSYTPLPEAFASQGLQMAEPSMRNRARWTRLHLTLPLGAAALLLASWLLLVRGTTGSWSWSLSRQKLRSKVEGMLEVKAQAECNLRDHNAWTKTSLRKIYPVRSTGACRAMCEADLRCEAWTWGMQRDVDGLTDVCFLKERDKDSAKHPWHTKHGATAGLACQIVSGIDGAPALNASGGQSSTRPPSGLLSMQLTTQRTSTTSTTTAPSTSRATATSSPTTTIPPAPTTRGRYRGDSLFCFALMLPTGYEPSLIRMQYKEHASLFACDEYAVYSNQVIELAPDVRTVVINSDLKCTYGGEFKTALNLNIFMAVWARVIMDGTSKRNDWTIKVDPDCVFFPWRLREVLHEYADEVYPNGMYLNNCKFGMHGPLEVFSRLAVEAWFRGHEQCVQHFTALCSGPCQWGEDMFVDQCMMKVLKAKREFEGLLLLEDHCKPPPDWMTCSNSSIVAFHPFKTVNRYTKCVNGIGQ